MSEVVSIAKKTLLAKGFNPCKLTGTYTVQLNLQKASKSGWIAFNCTAIAADGEETLVTIGASLIASVPSPLWEDTGETIDFKIGAAASITFTYEKDDFSSTIVAAGDVEEVEEEEEEEEVKPVKTTKTTRTKK